jgi:hypothetical protein
MRMLTMRMPTRISFLAIVVAIATSNVARSAEQAAAPQAAALEPIVVGTPERIDVFPTEFKLQTPRRRMHLLVTGYYADGQSQDLTRAAEYKSSNDGVVVVENGVAVPKGDGQAEIVIRAGSHEQRIKVEVSGQGTPDPISFHFETLTALTKQGCSGGACHGSPSGKGGFRLSLAAYDPVLDERTLIREDYNRRTNVADPDASLLLAKPMMQLAHGGGKRLAKDDAAYVALRQWIAEGCRVDPPDAPHCVKLEVFPKSGRVLKRPAHTQQLLVLAHFSDGSVRDVTGLSTYTTSDAAVATPRPDGLVVGHDRGEAAIVVRHLEKVETCYLTFVKDIEGFAWSNPAQFNFVDKLVDAKLEQLKYAPAELCTDDEFLRRAYLDVIGVLPTLDETKAFLADTSADKRKKLIDTLLERPEYAKYWALKWGDLLRLNNKSVTSDGVFKYYQWVVRAFESNMPYDQFARELLLSQGSTFSNPAANYYRATADTNDCTETTAQVFLGVRMQCCKCHNHPFERWTQDNYYGLGAFFNRIQRKPTARKDELVVWIARGGEVTQPRTGKQMKPWLPLVGDAAEVGEDDRREQLVSWLMKPENPFFAKVEVNRLWSQLMGRGIVEPIDDFRDSNPPSNAPLLDALAEDFVKHGYDRKHTLRTILNSRTYQASAATTPLNKDDAKYFSHARVRLLAAEPLLDAICQVTSVAESFPNMPAGTRATQLPSPDVNNDFLKVFGQPERQTACACERSNESNLSQALQLFNGPLIHAKLQNKENRFHKMAAAGKTNEEIVRELYLAALCREPNDAEMAASVGHINGKEDRGKALEDVCWAILNTNEFLFQH